MATLTLEEARCRYEEAYLQYAEAMREAFPVGRLVMLRWGTKWIGPFEVTDYTDLRVRIQNVKTGKRRWVVEQSIQLAD